MTATIKGSGIGNFSTGLITASGSNASHTIPLNVAVDTSGSGGLSIDTRRLVLISDCKGGQSCYVVSNPPATFDDAPTGTTGLIGRPSASSSR